MPGGYSIAGISPIGLGLTPSAFGDYSNFMPSSMGMGTSGYGTGYGSDYGMGLMGGFGMGGMMNGLMEYQMYMQKMQNQLDLENLNHVNAMHSGVIQNQVKAHEESLSGIIQQLTTDAAVQSRIMTLHNKIKQGDQKGAIQEYDKLVARVYETFDKEIAAKGISIGRADEARRIIEHIYGNIVSATSPDGQHTLREDLDKYCDGAFMAGVVGAFRGDNDKRYREETINHIYGERIDNVGSHKGQKMLGNVVGGIGSVFRDMIGGTVLGAGTWAAGTSIVAGISLLCGKTPSWWWKTTKGGAGWVAIAGIAAMGAYDVIKRLDNKAKSNHTTAA